MSFIITLSGHAVTCDDEELLHKVLLKNNCYVTLKKNFIFQRRDKFSKGDSLTLVLKKKYNDETEISSGRKMQVEFSLSNSISVIDPVVNHIALGADIVTKKTIEDGGELKLECHPITPVKR
jgi:hypothetical protein